MKRQPQLKWHPDENKKYKHPNMAVTPTFRNCLLSIITGNALVNVTHKDVQNIEPKIYASR